ncbi:MAG TPA: glycosyltransferase [Candidatus Kapabacteria bacterium]|nr:glycosyltransferase [Candidatus Kapabacteria bacterium]
MKTLITVIFISSLCISIGCNKQQTPSPATVTGTGISQSSVDLKIGMRKLWEDHVTWTRNVIFILVDGLPGKDQALARLMKNQDDIGNAIKPIYGDAAGKALTDLLHSHIAISADVVLSAKANDKAGLDAASKKWSDNADSIAAFLSSANPNWPLADMKKMMHDHLDLTTNEAVARIKKDYDADVKAYDKVHDEILAMSDMLADGIIKQYPDKFK